MSKSRDIADSAATINYIDGLTSDAQTQLNSKATLDASPTFTGTVTATAFSGDGSGLTGVDSLPSQTGASGKFLTTDGTNASWDAVDVSSEITGTLPVANGGTGATTLTANNVLLGNGTSAPLAVAPSTSGNVLTSNGTTWQSTAPAGGGGWELISTVSGTNALTFLLNNVLSDSYYDYIVEGNLDTNSTYPNPIGFEFIKSGGTYQTSGYATYYWGCEWTTTGINTGTGSTSYYSLSGQYLTPGPMYLRIQIARPQTSSGGNAYIYVQSQVNALYSTPALPILNNGGVNVAADYVGLRIKDFRSGPATLTGSIRVWGRKTS